MAEQATNGFGPDKATRGDLSKISFGRVFAGLCGEKRAGYLDILDKPSEEGGKIMKRVIMVEGQYFAAKGGARNETLPEILLSLKKITHEELDKLREDTKGDYNEMENMVMSGRVVPPSELAELMTRQVEIKIKSLFSMIRGFYEFKEQDKSTLMSKYGPMPMSPEKLIFEGVREFYPESRIKKEYEGIEKKTFQRARDWEARVAAGGVNLKAVKALGALGDSLPWSILLKGLPLGKDNAAFALALYFAGILTLDEGQDSFPIGDAYLAGEERKRVEEEKARLAREKAEAAKKAKQPVAAAAEVKKKEETLLPIEEMLAKELSDEEILAELDKLLKVCKNRENNFFDRLGVQESTPPAKIKQVYFKFARRFHPDARPDLFKDKVRERVEDLFTFITEAYDTLSDFEKRGEYEKSLRSKISKDDMDKATRAIQAEMELQKAEVLMKRGSWREAQEALKTAVELVPDEPEYKMYQAWVEYKIEGPAAAAKTRKQIKAIIEERKHNPDAYFYLGMIAKNEGDMAEAENYLGQALQKRPNDVEIKRELQVIQRKKQSARQPAQKSGGFFGKKK